VCERETWWVQDERDVYGGGLNVHAWVCHNAPSVSLRLPQLAT